MSLFYLCGGWYLVGSYYLKGKSDFNTTTATGHRMSPKTYNASCHCGNIKYTVALPEALAPEGTGKINRCHCTICTKNGYLLVYPKRTDVVFVNGSEAGLKEYFMGRKNKPHRFCSECSSSILIDFKDVEHEDMRQRLAMNVRGPNVVNMCLKHNVVEKG